MRAGNCSIVAMYPSRVARSSGVARRSMRPTGYLSFSSGSMNFSYRILAISLRTALRLARPEPVEGRACSGQGIPMLRVSSITLSVLLIVGLLTTVSFHAQQAGGRGGGGGGGQAATGGRTQSI